MVGERGAVSEQDDDWLAATECQEFQAVRPEVYGAKVKTLLTGLPLSTDEALELRDDPDSLADKVDAWQSMPEAVQKRIEFFRTAFQQEGSPDGVISTFIGVNNAPMGRFEGVGEQGANIDVSALLAQNVEDSFARTAEYIVETGKPFTDVVTTRTYMMTTALMTLLAYNDIRRVTDPDDNGRSRTRYAGPAASVDEITFLRNGSNMSWAQSIDPSHANFMRFHVPDLHECAGGSFSQGNPVHAAFLYLFGRIDRLQNVDGCNGGNARITPVLRYEDFFDWRPVTVRQPAQGEEPDFFLNYESFRTADEIVLAVPRVGFFTTPGFLGRWATNDSNDARVTINQTLISALGISFDGEDVTIPALDDALDGEHANPNTECYACHKTLDPMRQFFRSQYTITYHLQEDEEIQAVAGVYARNGKEVAGDIYTLGDQLASDPAFAPAWVQKLCFYANSAECPETSDEFKAVVTDFSDNGFDFRRLTRSLLSSSLVTSQSCVEGGTGDFPGLSRAQHLCATLSARLDEPDICGIQTRLGNGLLTRLQRDVNALIGIIPSDAFSRGSESPITISDSNLFIASATEEICDRIAQQLVGDGKKYEPSDAESVIKGWVTGLMGLPETHALHSGGMQVLTRHYQQAQEAEVNEAVALQSTFMLACMSPSVKGMGL